MEIERKIMSRALHEVALDEVDAGAPQCRSAACIFDARRDHLHAALVCQRNEIAQFLAHGIVVNSKGVPFFVELTGTRVGSHALYD